MDFNKDYLVIGISSGAVVIALLFLMEIFLRWVG
jgi:hypothetical protein